MLQYPSISRIHFGTVFERDFVTFLYLYKIVMLRNEIFFEPLAAEQTEDGKS
jgi:hypothetical protein